MGHFVEVAADKIDVGDDEYIEIKRRMGVGDYDHIDWLCDNANVGRTLALLETNIVGWNLKRDGKELALTRENVVTLEYDIALKIIAEIGARNARVSKKA